MTLILSIPTIIRYLLTPTDNNGYPLFQLAWMGLAFGILLKISWNTGWKLGEKIARRAMT